MAGLTSAIPAAIDALVAYLKTIAAAYTDPVALLVIDGDIGTLDPPAFVQIGAAINWVQRSAGLGNLRRDESFTLDCVIQWFDGGAGPEVASTVRANAFGVLEAIVLAVTAAPTLNGSVRFAQVEGGPAMTQDTTANGGWAVQVPFQVRCDVQLER